MTGMDQLRTRASSIIQAAIDIASTSGVPASAAINRALAEAAASDGERVLVQECFGDALVSVQIGNGRAFHQALLERALAVAGGSPKTKLNRQPAALALGTNPNKGKEERRHMSDNNTNATATTKSKAKKYAKGETFQLVAEMALLPSGEGATVPFRLSRKAAKDGIRTIPAGTPMKYIEARAVFADKASSKRMVFELADGTLVAGVVNHIDADDPYNKRPAKADEGIDTGTATPADETAAA